MKHEEFERQVRAVVQAFRAGHPDEELEVVIGGPADDEHLAYTLPVEVVEVAYQNERPVLVVRPHFHGAPKEKEKV